MEAQATSACTGAIAAPAIPITATARPMTIGLIWRGLEIIEATCIVRYGVDSATLYEEGVRVQRGSSLGRVLECLAGDGGGAKSLAHRNLTILLGTGL
jgi:hypothetical protein